MMVDDLDKALTVVAAAREAPGSGLGGAAGQHRRRVARAAPPRRGHRRLTDQTSAHDLRLGYIPRGYTVDEAAEFRGRDPAGYENAVLDSMVEHVRAMLAYQKDGTVTFDYGNNLRGQVADRRGMTEAFQIRGFVPLFIRPLFCKGSGPVPLGGAVGQSARHRRDRRRRARAVSGTRRTCADGWSRRRHKVHFQGLPARICWLEYGERAEMGQRFNWLVAKEKVDAPIVIGRDHLDSGSVASPNRETEGMKDGSDAIADWPLLNALVNAVNGASWVSIHHGGGVGIGYSIHAGMVCVADGSPQAEERLHRVLTSDPATGILRHADAGYEEAIATARHRHVDIPMLPE